MVLENTYFIFFRDRANSSSTSASLLSGDLADCVKVDKSPDNEKKERG